MELEILKKKISSYRGEGGRVKKVSDELLMEILHAWEQWTGPISGFAQAVGMHRHSIPKLIGKAKRLKREGFPGGDFKEIRVVEPTGGGGLTGCNVIEMNMENGRILRFGQVDQLVEFLKKAA
jgi:hypothetical protein